MRYFRVSALLLLAVLWACPAFAEITPEAQALMDNHRCMDGSTLTEVFESVESMGMRVPDASLVTLENGQKALQVGYTMAEDRFEEVYDLQWLVDSEGHQLLAPVRPKVIGRTWGNWLSAEVAELGKACWRFNLNYYYQWENEEDERHSTFTDADGNVFKILGEEGNEFVPNPVDLQIKQDPAILAVIPAHGFAGGVAELVKKAGLWMDSAQISTVPSWRNEKESVPGVYIELFLVGNRPANWDLHKGGGPHVYILDLAWRLAPGSRYFQPLTDNAALLSAGILPKLVPRVCPKLES